MIHTSTDAESPTVEPAALAEALRDGVAAGVAPIETYADAEALSSAIAVRYY